MLLKLLLIVIAMRKLVIALPEKKATNDRIAALLVKDSENGELRFLTGTSTVNQLINRKQNFLEQFRPVNATNNNNVTPVIIGLNGGVVATYTSVTTPTSGTSPTSITVLNRRRGVPQRGNKRRRVNRNSSRRRRRRRPANKPQVILVRPQNG